MSSNKDWFYDFKERKGVVYMGDESTCKIGGIGKIKLKLHDGIMSVV